MIHPRQRVLLIRSLMALALLLGGLFAGGCRISDLKLDVKEIQIPTRESGTTISPTPLLKKASSL